MTGGIIAAIVVAIVMGIAIWFLSISGVYQVLQTSRERQRRNNRS